MQAPPPAAGRAQPRPDRLSGYSLVRRTVRSLTVMSGCLTVLVGSAAYSYAGHPAVDPRRPALVLPPELVGTGWAFVVVAVALGMVACAAVWRPKSPEGVFGSAVGQCAAAVLMFLGTAAGSSLRNAWIYAPDDRCVYASCWPADAQALTGSAPGLISAVSLLAAALLLRRVGWTARVVPPALAWVFAAVVLRAAWSPWLLPLFQGPP